jgi:hypothetical protein
MSHILARLKYEFGEIFCYSLGQDLEKILARYRKNESKILGKVFFYVHVF